MSDLLLRLAGPEDDLDAATAEALRGLDAPRAERLLDRAGGAGLGGLVARRLVQAGSAVVPAAALGVAEARWRSAVARGMFLEGALLRAVGTLEARGIPVIAFKGALLSRQLHGDPGVRDCDDTDLLVAPADVVRAEEALVSLGYRCALEIPDRSLALFRRVGHELPWVDDGGSVVDLHWALAAAFDRVPFEDAGIASRAARVAIGGASVATLSDEDLLVYLCYHGCHSLWARLAWVADVARLLEVRPALRDGGALRRADAVGARRMLLVGLLLARDLLGAPIAWPFVEAAMADPAAAVLARRFADALIGRAPLPAEGGGRTLIHVSLREGALRRARYLRDVAFTPRPDEWEGRAASGSWRAVAGLARGAAATISVAAAALAALIRGVGG